MLLGRLPGLRDLQPRRMLQRLSGVQGFVLSFAGLVLVGTLGLLVLPGLYVGPRLGVVDALFTATSAVCVTGLILVDTATYFTVWGQLWLLVLIQIGGLGILTLAVLLIRLIGGGSLALEEASVAGAALRRFRPGELLRWVVLFAFGVELVGALLLWFTWRGPMGPVAAVWPAVFHAVSAFCNAGFSTFTDSLVAWRSSLPTLGTIMALIVVGGIGVPVVVDLRDRRRGRRLTTHSRLALGMTAVLLVGAGAAFYVFESGQTLAGLGLADRVSNAAFMAVTPRTAGFNTVSYDAVTNPSLALTIGLMVIGGSPGSTAGGIKTTTAALLVLAFIGRVRRRRSVLVGGRSVPPETVQRAIGLAVGAFGILGMAVFLLLLTQPAGATHDRLEFIRLAFEAHSAFGTVGLSMGGTPHLTTSGRLLVTLLMFVGRVGPLAFAAAMTGRTASAVVRHAYEDVVVG